LPAFLNQFIESPPLFLQMRLREALFVLTQITDYLALKTISRSFSLVRAGKGFGL